MTNDDERADFEARARECRAWQETAREFALAANYLIDWYDPPTERGDPGDFSFNHQGSNLPMMVLFAAAVENLLKALLVAQGKSSLAEGKLSKRFEHHDLPRYASETGLLPVVGERELLEQLRDLMVAGRYPIPKTPGANPGAWRLRYPEDVERVWALLERLEEALRSTGQRCLPPRDLRTRYRPPGYSVREAP